MHYVMGVRQHRARVVFVVALLTLVVGCGIQGSELPTATTVRQTTTTTDPMDPLVGQIQISAAEVSAYVAMSDSEDLSLEWSDLYGDIMSALSDLKRDPSGVDIDGLMNRVKSFAAVFKLEEKPVWIEFVSNIEQFLEVLSDGEDAL